MNTASRAYYREHLKLLVRQARDAGVTTAELPESTSQVLAPVVAEEAAAGYASSEEGLQFLLKAEGSTVPIAEATELHRPGDAVTRQALTAQIKMEI